MTESCKFSAIKSTLERLGKSESRKHPKTLRQAKHKLPVSHTPKKTVSISLTLRLMSVYGGVMGAAPPADEPSYQFRMEGAKEKVLSVP